MARPNQEELETRMSLIEQSVETIARDFERFQGRFDDIDKRIRWLERTMWLGLGGLGTLQIVLNFWPKT